MTREVSVNKSHSLKALSFVMFSQLELGSRAEHYVHLHVHKQLETYLNNTWNSLKTH